MKIKKLLLLIGLQTLTSTAQTTTAADPQRLKEVSEKICDCLNEIESLRKTAVEKNTEIRTCIENGTKANNLLSKLTDAYNKGKEDPEVKNINITYNPSEKAYGTPFYFEVERYLMNHCEQMQLLVASNDYIFPNSISNNVRALEYYSMGQEFFKNKQYASAEKAYKSAIEIDPIFSFAWDNLGLTYRWQEKFDLALEAYNNSLMLEPNGFMPLQNIPIVYELMEEYDRALTAYQNITAVYPNSAEADYGAGRIYVFFKNDLEKGLDHLCKAYLNYISTNSPYRVDAEQLINYVHAELDKQHKKEVFYKILKQNNIDVNEE